MLETQLVRFATFEVREPFRVDSTRLYTHQAASDEQTGDRHSKAAACRVRPERYERSDQPRAGILRLEANNSLADRLAPNRSHMQ